MHRWMLGEVLLLLAGGWAFYRLKSKDDEF
jgi:hypothetical protein